eukprot:7301411-Pyramimonas_sp.AAC.1
MLRINWAGNTCVAWGPVSTSKLKAHSHSSERVNNIWIAQKVRCAEIGEEDCFFQECSKYHPEQEKLAVPMSPWIHVAWVQWGPLQRGEPHHRNRIFSFGCIRNRLKWIGPETHEAAQKELEDIFGAKD